MQTILIVDDDADILTGLEINLTRQGYGVLKAGTARAAVDLAVGHSPALVVLDVMLPDGSGFDVCVELRKRGVESPVILLTARSEEIDKIVGLEIGADDYVTKPFSVRELIARIRACLRRVPERPTTLKKYCFAAVEVNFEKQECTKSGVPVALTAREFDILQLLIRTRGTVVTRQRVLTDVFGYHDWHTDRAVDTHIARLRRKLEDNPARPRHILSVYGGGYKFAG